MDHRGRGHRWPTGGCCQIRLDAKNRPKIAYLDIANSALKFAQRLDALSFKVNGSKSRKTKKGSAAVTGTASSSVASVEWKIAGKPFHSVKPTACPGGKP